MDVKEKKFSCHRERAMLLQCFVWLNILLHILGVIRNHTLECVYKGGVYKGVCIGGVYKVSIIPL